jgi:5-oxopent-3-ene-1,2,5-tricarboxylate decarboxylase / 2-hydroxyhepta-2,4-diene-1,7-dioate isomerase
MDFAPYRLSGRVYGTLLNHRSAVDAIGDSISKAPYKAPPSAPILYLKPANTFSSNGQSIAVPDDASALEVGASVGLVMGRFACRLTESNAMEHVAGFVLVNDVSVPHLPYYRPSIRSKARDGFCSIGPYVAPRVKLQDLNELSIRVSIDQELKQASSTGDLVRPIRRLLVDVTEFMTLQPGDILTIGVAGNAPLVHAGQTAVIEAEGLGRLENPFVAGRP